MAQILNQASITFNYGATTGEAISNIATTELQGPLSVDKNALKSVFRNGDTIDYVLEVTNNGLVGLSNIIISDNLGAYPPVPAGATVNPLRYVTGSAFYLIDGELLGTANVTATNPLTFTHASLASGETLTIIYKATLTQYAGLTAGSTIKNVSTFTADGITEAVTSTDTITVDTYADVSITKSMSPNPVMDNGTIIYTFNLRNNGNTNATSIELSDTFALAPTINTVTVGTANATITTDYTYAAGVFHLFARNNGADTIDLPAATITQAANGVVTVAPSELTITVRATL